jgi:branched-chain amino acid transport system ATP-binding protein
MTNEAGHARGEALGVTDLSVRFGGLWAVKDVTLSVPSGQRRAIIGPNGAGKTTLTHLVSGVLRPTSGQIRLFGTDVTRRAQYARARMGMARTFQITNTFPDLTVLENAYVATQALSRRKWGLRPARTYEDFVAGAERIVRRLGLSERADVIESELSYGEQRQLEIALALATEPRLLLLDEPLAGLSAAERSAVRDLVAGIERDVTIMLIEHNMEMVMEFADVVTVLDHGQVIAEGTPEEVRRDPEVRRIYLGSAAA